MRKGTGAVLPSEIDSLWQFERSLAGTAKCISGVDEAGRGALAGPVYAAAVVLSNDPALWGAVNDSKLLTLRQRETLYLHIQEHAVAVGVGVASREEIDVYNILQASRLAMGRAITALADQFVELVLVDGPYAPTFLGTEIPAVPVIDGDAKCSSIAAASIVAKVERDRAMKEFGSVYPGYGFERNVGYGTREHLQALRELGPTPIHRTSFSPVQALLQTRLDLT